jgi:hypothetical protein
MGGCFSTPSHSISGACVKVAETNEESVYVIMGPTVVTIKKTSDAAVIKSTGVGCMYSANVWSFGAYKTTSTEIDVDANHLIEIR